MRSTPGMAPEASTAAFVEGTSPHPCVVAVRYVEEGKQLRAGCRVRLVPRRALILTGLLPELAQILLHQGGLARKVLVKRSLRYRRVARDPFDTGCVDAFAVEQP